MRNTPSKSEHAILLSTSAGVFLFYALLFVVPSGYSYGAVLMLLPALVSLGMNGLSLRSSDDRLLAAVLALYFAAFVVSNAYLGNPWRDLDQHSRALATIPILALLIRIPFRPELIWAGAAVGVTGSAGVAWWQTAVLGLDRAEGYLNIIHFGNIALVFGTLCIAGAYYIGHARRGYAPLSAGNDVPGATRAAAFGQGQAAQPGSGAGSGSASASGPRSGPAIATAPQQRRRPWGWWALFAVGLLSALYSVVSSGSRASWVAIPFVLALCVLSFASRRNISIIASGIFAFLVTCVIVFQVPDSPLRERYDAAVNDIVLLVEEGEADTSLGARVVMWEGALLNIAERPILGWNFADYHEALEQKVKDGELNPVALKFSNNLHNAYFQAIAFQGLLGLVALLGLYGAPLYAFGKRLRHPDARVRAFALSGSSLAVCYMVFSLTQVIVARNNGIMFFLLATATLWGALRQLEGSYSPPSRSTIKTPSSSS